MDIDKAIMMAAQLRRLINDLPFKAPEIMADHKREIANAMNRIAVALELTGPNVPTPEGFVRIEIPVVVGPRGYLAMEVDTAFDPDRVPEPARLVAKRMAGDDQYYSGTPYVAVVYVPAYTEPEPEVVTAEVTPC